MVIWFSSRAAGLTHSCENMALTASPSDVGGGAAVLELLLLESGESGGGGGEDEEFDVALPPPPLSLEKRSSVEPK